MDSLYISINCILLLLQGILCIHALYKISKCIVDLAAIFELIYCIWYVPIIYDMMTGMTKFSYAYDLFFTNYNEYFNWDIEALTFYNFISTFIMLAFGIGYEIYRKKISQQLLVFDKEIHISRKKYVVIQGALLLIWILLEIRGYFMYGGNLRGFFSATNKNMYGSTYVEMIIIKLPLLMFVNSLCANARLRKKYAGFIYGAIALFSAIQTHQRREMISNALFVVILYIMYRGSIKLRQEHVEKKIKKYIMFIFAAAFCMVPLLWFLRVHDNQLINNGVTKVVYTRGFFEVLFRGSGATGFPTLITIDNFRMRNEVNFYFRHVLFILQSFIPRNIFPAKVSLINSFVLDAVGAKSNMSLFYINDIYFTFGVLSIPVSFLIGMIFSKLYGFFLSGNRLEDKVFLALFMSEIVLLFKNGSTSFVVDVVFVALLLFVDFTLLGMDGFAVKLRGGRLIIRTNRYKKFRVSEEKSLQ